MKEGTTRDFDKLIEHRELTDKIVHNPVSIEQVKAEQDKEMLIENHIGLTKETLEQYLAEVFSEKKRDYRDTSILKIYHNKDILSFAIGNHTTGILGIKFYMAIYESYSKDIMFEKIYYNGVEVEADFVNKLLDNV